MRTNQELNRRDFMSGSASMAGLAMLAACQSQANALDDWALIDDAAAKVIEDKFTPGLSISVMRNGEFLYSRGHGLLNVETQTPMSAKSVFKIASITKQMIAALLLRLQEKGQLSLFDTLAKYFPEFPGAEDITLYQLATHTAGLGDYARLSTRSVDQTIEYNDQSFLALLKRTDPLFVAEPGTEERYSNTDYGLLGLIVNQITGQHYGQVLQTEFFDKIGLQYTAYDHQFEVIRERVSGYSPWQAMPSGFANGDYIS